MWIKYRTAEGSIRSIACFPPNLFYSCRSFQNLENLCRQSYLGGTIFLQRQTFLEETTLVRAGPFRTPRILKWQDYVEECAVFHTSILCLSQYLTWNVFISFLLQESLCVLIIRMERHNGKWTDKLVRDLLSVFCLIQAKTNSRKESWHKITRSF